MLKSMTGFGRSELVNEERKFVVEIKGVNHRYCDMSIKIPKKLSFFEAGVRTILKNYISRGKVDVFILYEDYVENKICVKYNFGLIKEYMNCLTKISEEFGIENDITAVSLTKYPEVLTLEEQSIDENQLWISLEEAVKQAARQFVNSRLAEGLHLKEDLYSKLDGMLQDVQFIEERSPRLVTEYREKLTAKVQELLGDTKLEESILATELIIYADKICVDEEVVRLKSHIKSTKATLDAGENIGRKLDFIAQEMNREANTILSKSNDLSISQKAIDLKTEIEKIREQIQNIE